MPEKKKLRNARHPYYCVRQNYRAAGNDQPGFDYDSWADFMAEWEESDPDMNLLFRWDWANRFNVGTKMIADILRSDD